MNEVVDFFFPRFFRNPEITLPDPEAFAGWLLLDGEKLPAGDAFRVFTVAGFADCAFFAAVLLAGGEVRLKSAAMPGAVPAVQSASSTRIGRRCRINPILKICIDDVCGDGKPYGMDGCFRGASLR